MIRLSLVLMSVSAVVCAPAATADPNNLVPDCTSGQVAQPGECAPELKVVAGQSGLPLFGMFPGANPNIPPTITPANFPTVFPLGVTPRDVPTVLPLGLTPPAPLPFS
ncbi:MAG: hypothetical protein ACKOQ4_16400 [Mycobacterium sp.]